MYHFMLFAVFVGIAVLLMSSLMQGRQPGRSRDGMSRQEAVALAQEMIERAQRLDKRLAAIEEIQRPGPKGA